MSKVLLLLLFTYVSALAQEELTQAKAFLTQYGYLQETKHGENKKLMFDAVANFQNMAGLNITGVLDNAALQMMDVPRCGMADMLTRPPQRRIWKSSELTYRIDSYPETISQEDVNAIIQQAFDIWSKYVNLRFFRTKNKNADFKVDFTSRIHGDTNFDGPGKVLAHAFYPRNGRIHFDLEENWSKSNGRGLVNLYQVAAHEIGHALGLTHSDVRQAIMLPYIYYNKNFERNLHDDDISRIRMLYGDIKRAKPAKTMEDSIICSSTPVDSILSYGNAIYVFKGENVVKLNSDLTKAKVAKISNIFSGVSSNVKATYYRQKLYLFSNQNFWRYDDNIRLEKNYPRSISSGFPGIPSNIDGVINYNGKLIFFKGVQYWKYDSSKFPPINPVYPKTIASLEGLPNSIDAVFYQKNTLSLYAFKGNQVYKFDLLQEKVTDPPFSATKDFFGCSS